MRFTHVSLGIVSGLVLVLIIAWVFLTNIPRDNESFFEETQLPSNEEEINTDTTIVADDEFSGTHEDVQVEVTIDLQGQNLTHVPSYVFQRVETEKLDVSNNMLTGSLPAEVRHLSNLKTLILSDNNFTGIPAEVGQLRTLEVLDVSNNAITGLPYEIGLLQNLKVLDLRGNEYSKADLEKIKETLPSTVTIFTD